jgi:arylsulfatase A-like enzyme
MADNAAFINLRESRLVMRRTNIYWRALGVYFGLCACLVPDAWATGKPRPNIVILVADDWGFSDVGAFGGEIATPHLDALAAKGSRFSNFHVAATCSPTRAMLLTGVDHHRNGVGNMPETTPPEQEGKPGYAGVLAPDTVTLATMLRDSGYHTYIAGKWHVGKGPENLPGRRGFERSFIQADSGTDNWENRPYMMLYDKTYWFEQDRAAQLPKDFYSSRFFVDKTIGYIREQAADGKPFMAYIGFQANHIPIQAPTDLVAKYSGRYDQGWTALRQARRDGAVRTGMMPAGMPITTLASTVAWDSLSPDKQRLQARRMEVYAGMAEAMDAEVGRLVQHLQSSGQYDNTVFVFLSDNGSDPADPFNIPSANAWVRMNYQVDVEPLGGKGTFSANGPSWASATVGPLQGYKDFASEGGLRVPLIVSGLPGVASGRVVSALTHVNDIVPTLLDAAGIASHQGQYAGRTVQALSGHSLLPLLQGKADYAYRPDEPLGYELAGSAALFLGDYKLVKNIAPLGDGQWRLFNLRQDPGETQDLQSAQPSVFASMRDAYDKYAQDYGVLPVPEGFDLQKAGLYYAVHHYLLPKLRAAWPQWLALAGVVLSLVYWRRRRRTIS